MTGTDWRRSLLRILVRPVAYVLVFGVVTVILGGISLFLVAFVLIVALLFLVFLGTRAAIPFVGREKVETWILQKEAQVALALGLDDDRSNPSISTALLN